MKKIDQIIVFITIIASLFVIPLILTNFLDTFVSPQDHPNSFPEWDANRLLMSFILKSDYKLYYPPDQGPVAGMVYGPVMAIAYLPATIANSPTIALILGKIINLALYFVPVFLLYINESNGNLKKIWICLSVFLLFCFFTFHIPTLSYNAFRIHADTPALGLSALACLFIYYQKNNANILPLILSATCAILSVWAKQISLPILFALPLYLYLKDDYKSLKKYLICLIITGLIISSIFVFIFDYKNLLFNLITIPSNHPWIRENKIMALLIGSKDLFSICFLPFILVGFISSYQWSTSSINFNLKSWIKENNWTLFLIVSIFMIPTSILGRVKIGGNVNAMYTVYFLTIAGNLALLKLALNYNISEQKISRNIGKYLIIIFLSAFLAGYVYPPIPEVIRQLSILPNNIHQIVYEYAKKDNDKTYFPWHPLSVMMATGKLYHFDSACYDREMAGFPVTKQHFLENIPENIEFIATPLWTENANLYLSYNSKFWQQYLPEFSVKTELPELPGFVVYQRKI